MEKMRIKENCLGKLLQMRLWKFILTQNRNKENTLQEFTREERFPSLKKTLRLMIIRWNVFQLIYWIDTMLIVHTYESSTLFENMRSLMTILVSFSTHIFLNDNNFSWRCVYLNNFFHHRISKTVSFSPYMTWI